MKNTMEVIITEAKNVRWYFQTIMYESMLKGNSKVILSTIQKYQLLAEKVIVTLKMWGFELDTSMENNPVKEIQKGMYQPLTLYKYHLNLHPMVQEIMRSIQQNEFNKNVLLSLLNSIHLDRSEHEKYIDESLKDEKFKEAITYILSKLAGVTK